MGPRVLASSELYTVDVIYTRYTVNEVKKKKKAQTSLWGASLCRRLGEGKKTNACIQGIYRGTSGALRYSNEMRCFGMHGGRGAARKKREKINK